MSSQGCGFTAFSTTLIPSAQISPGTWQPGLPPRPSSRWPVSAAGPGRFRLCPAVCRVATKSRSRGSWRTETAPPDLLALSLGVPGTPFWSFGGGFKISEKLRDQRRSNLAAGIRAAASAAVDVAGGARKVLGAEKTADTAVPAGAQLGDLGVPVAGRSRRVLQADRRQRALHSDGRGHCRDIR